MGGLRMCEAVKGVSHEPWRDGGRLIGQDQGEDSFPVNSPCATLLNPDVLRWIAEVGEFVMMKGVAWILPTLRLFTDQCSVFCLAGLHSIMEDPRPL